MRQVVAKTQLTLWFIKNSHDSYCGRKAIFEKPFHFGSEHVADAICPSSSTFATMDTALVGKYEGETQNGRYHGRGKITYGDSFYEGTFFNGQMHGEGKLTVKSKFPVHRNFS
jgi:hypothetical protein